LPPAAASGGAKRRADPSLRRFAIDLDVARAAVIAAAGGDANALARQLPRLWKYSLLRCSLTSQIDRWPTELFTALVALGRSNEARDRAGLLSDPKKRADVLTAIGIALLKRGEQAAAVEALRQARAAADAIPADDQRRAAALDAVAAALARAG
ncbi:MAG: hypothetical protein RMM10_13220, partial [Anaerolineae bacterium]|uniref:hypothetical protein n=1 Tax=Thermoflexus sp. TaxID=1969742 RepID=UPI0025CDA107